MFPSFGHWSFFLFAIMHNDFLYIFNTFFYYYIISLEKFLGVEFLGNITFWIFLFILECWDILK